MAKVNPIQFLRQVKQEVRKIAWAPTAEVRKTLIMVVIIVALASGFFFLVDLFLGWVVQFVLGFGG